VNQKAIGLLLVGVAAVVVGVVLLAVVVPRAKNIPADYTQTVDFQGTYSLVQDQAFYLQLMTNPTVGKLVASPDSLKTLARQDVGILLSSDAFKALLANPAALQAIITNPQAAASSADPAVRAVVTNPAAQALLADAVIRGILADPAALKLVLDPRTMNIITNPGKLPLQNIPLMFHRVRTAERTEGGTLFLHQDFDATMQGTGAPVAQVSSKATLAVNRATREYAPGGTEPRIGRFAFPSGIKQSETYHLWINEVYAPLPAKYSATEEVNGLTVDTFKIQEKGVTVPADVTATLKTEPSTGITVDFASDIAYNLANPALGNPTLFRAAIKYTDGSIAASVADASSASTRLLCLGRIVPIVLVVGGLLAVVSVVIAMQPRQEAGCNYAGPACVAMSLPTP
jgi:hypothetical protein